MFCGQTFPLSVQTFSQRVQSLVPGVQNWHVTAIHINGTFPGHLYITKPLTCTRCVRDGSFSAISYAYRPFTSGISDRNCVRNRSFGAISYAYRPSPCDFDDRNCVRDGSFSAISYAYRAFTSGISALVNKNWTRTSSIMYLLEPIIMHGCCLNGHPCTVWVSCS